MLCLTGRQLMHVNFPGAVDRGPLIRISWRLPQLSAEAQKRPGRHQIALSTALPPHRPQGSMAKSRFGVRGTCATLFIYGGLLTGCAQGPSGPLAAVITTGAPEHPSGPAGARPPQAASPVKGRSIIVKPGQSLGGIAERHQVSTRAIIAANHLTPPYDLE